MRKLNVTSESAQFQRLAESGTRREAERESPPSAVFWGGALSFSDQMIRVVNAEIAEVDFYRIGDPEELRPGPPPRVLVLHETVASGAALGAELIRDRRGAKIAIAYRTPAVAARLAATLTAEADLPDIGFLPMEVQFDAWFSILRLLLCGQDFLPGEIVRARGALDGDDSPRRLEPAAFADINLTPRETQVLPLVAAGKPNKSIAIELGLSQHTVKLHMHNILAKLGLPNRTSAANWYQARLADPRRPKGGGHADSP